MDYQQTLDFLFSQLPMFSRIGAAAYKKDLTNTLLLCEAIDNPQHKIKTIHIAGTNGKGSTSHMLAAVFQKAGYKTGLYTSPHLKDFRERIKINGNMIPEQEVVAFTKIMMPLIHEISPSFFEITVAMAFNYFAKEAVDIAIIETGLGGRLDSTNIIQPELCIITNIGYDHQHLLGNSLTAIATEKAGIIKKGVPVIIGETTAETKIVFEEKARQMEAPLFFAGQNITIKKQEAGPKNLHVQFHNHATQEEEHLTLDLTGLYQAKNIKAVLVAIDLCRKKGYIIQKEAVHAALKSVKKMTGLFGRWELLQQSPTIIADVAHNVDGIKEILTAIKHFQLNSPEAKLHIILGMVKDKEIVPALALLPKFAQYYFTQADIPRALPKEDLAALAKKAALDGEVYPDVNIALVNAKKQAKKEDLILIFGSIFLIGELDY